MNLKNMKVGQTTIVAVHTTGEKFLLHDTVMVRNDSPLLKDPSSKWHKGVKGIVGRSKPEHKGLINVHWENKTRGFYDPKDLAKIK